MYLDINEVTKEIFFADDDDKVYKLNVEDFKTISELFTERPEYAAKLITHMNTGLKNLEHMRSLHSKA